MKKFLINIFILISPTIVLVTSILIFISPKNYGSKLEIYQNSKIELIDNNSIIFFGDSSCGNGINSKLIGENTFNLSLTGNYISCGSLFQLKELVKRKKTPKKIFLMYTIDGYNRSSTPGYKLLNNSLKDIFYHKTSTFQNLFINMILGRSNPKLVIDRKNDFLKQNTNLNGYVLNEMKISISDDNKECIKEIANLCNIYGIDYTFMIGPNINLINNKSLVRFEEFFKVNNIRINTNYYLIPKEEMGDTHDHISPIFKHKSTRYYKLMIH